MANAGAIKGGEAYVEAFLDSSRLMRGLAGLKTTMQAWGKSVFSVGAMGLGAGTALLAPFVGATAVFSEVGGDLDDLSQRLGVSVESLSRLSFAAKMGGSSMETLEGGLRKMQKNLAEARDGSETAISAFADLGISVESLAGKSPDEQFSIIAAKIAAIQDPAKKTAAAMSVFGKSGAMLIPTLNGLSEFSDRADKLGLTVSSSDAQAAAAFGDKMEELWAVLKKGTFTIGAALAPSLDSLISLIVTGASTVAKFIDENRGLVTMGATLAASLAAGGVGLMVFGQGLSVIGTMAGWASTAISTIASVGATVGAALISGLGGAFAFLVSPVGLIVAGVAAVAAGVLYFSGLGSQIMSGVGGAFQSVATEALSAFEVIRADGASAFEGISGALAGGNFGLAASILWATLKLEWERGSLALQEIWEGFKGWFFSIGMGGFTAAAQILNNALSGVELIFEESVNFLQGIWEGFTGFIIRTWNSSIAFIKKAWIRLKGMFSDIDVKGEIAKIDAETEVKNESSRKSQADVAADREARQQQRRDQIEQDRTGANAVLDQQYQDTMDSLEDSTAESLRKAQAELEAAKKNFDEAVEQGKAAGAESVATAEKNVKGDGDPEGDLTAAESKISVASTFDASVASRLGASSPLQERATKAAEETAKTNVEIRDGIKETNSKLDKVPLMKVGV